MERVALALVAPFALAACATVSAPRQDSAIVAEATAFMAAYAVDLKTGDRLALGERYDPDGYWRVFDGVRTFRTHAFTKDHYATRWSPPRDFAWKDLAYDVAGPESVIVVGGFEWTTETEVEHYSYTAFLRKRDGAWRIRLEDETQFEFTAR